MQPRSDAALIGAVRAALAAAANPAKAGPMQAYMKSPMPFYGVQKPARLTALRPVFAHHALPDRGSWEATIRELWDKARYREERYAALDLARLHRYAAWSAEPQSTALYDHLIVTGAWWDLVDDVAIRLVGPALRADPGEVTPVIRRWSRDADRWRRRAAVICQVGSRDATEVGLLAACVLANAGDSDFFLRKGIGWALREHAKTDPSWVSCFVSTHRDVLSPLSIREATRNLAPDLLRAD